MGSNEYNNILDKIQNLQSIQNTLYNDMKDLPPNNNFERQQLLVTQINNINSNLITLFNNINQNKNTTNTFDPALYYSSLKVLETQLQDSRNKLEERKNEYIKTLRTTEISYYDSAYYAYILGIFRYIIYTCLFLIIIIFLRHRYILPGGIANGLIFIVIAIGLYLIITSLSDLSNRNNLVFDQYNFGIDFDNIPKHDTTSDGSNKLNALEKDFNKFCSKSMQNIHMLESGDCFGSGCCVGDGLSFDKEQMICKLDPGKKTKHEGFTCGSNLSPAAL